MTTVTTTAILDYADNLAASVALTAAAKAERENAETMANYPASAGLLTRVAERYERAAAALDRAREVPAHTCPDCGGRIAATSDAAREAALS